MMDLSRWALNTATKSLDTVSHNVSNVNTEGYSRQEVVQGTRTPEYVPSEGWYGTGVQVTNVVQMVDRLLSARITDKISDQEYYDSHLTQMERLETLANEAGETGIGQQLTEFFNAWQDVSNNPESSAVRSALRETANNLINRLETLSQDLLVVDRDMDTYLADATTEVNAICRRISELNSEILRTENSGFTANDYRDERVRQLNELAEYMDIQWFEDGDGSVTVLTGNGKTLVQNDYPSPSDADPLTYGPVAGYSKNQLIWRDSTLVLSSEEVTGGKMGAWLSMREEEIPDMQSFLDDLSSSLIFEVNALHSQGAGLNKFTSVTGTYEASSTTASFLSGATAFSDEVVSGSFDIWVYESGTRRQYTVDVEPSDTLAGLMDKINLAMGSGGVPNTNPSVNPVAGITSDNTLTLTADSGLEFAFANDTSNILAALGINTFFDGESAATIELNANITSDVNNIAAGRILEDGEHALGDNQNALDLADLKDADTMNGGSETFNESVVTWSSELGTKVSSDADNLNFAQTATDQLFDQRDSVSAVNLDEEMVKMIKFQRAYQMASKVISVADSLLTSLLEVKR